MPTALFGLCHNLLIFQGVDTICLLEARIIPWPLPSCYKWFLPLAKFWIHCDLYPTVTQWTTCSHAPQSLILLVLSTLPPAHLLPSFKDLRKRKTTSIKILWVTHIASLLCASSLLPSLREVSYQQLSTTVPESTDQSQSFAKVAYIIC